MFTNFWNSISTFFVFWSSFSCTFHSLAWWRWWWAGSDCWSQNRNIPEYRSSSHISAEKVGDVCTDLSCEHLHWRGRLGSNWSGSRVHYHQSWLQVQQPQSHLTPSWTHLLLDGLQILDLLSDPDPYWDRPCHHRILLNPMKMGLEKKLLIREENSSWGRA